jgi:hypothetical protein
MTTTMAQRLIEETLRRCLRGIEKDLLRHGKCFIEIEVDPQTDFLRARLLGPEEVEIRPEGWQP